MRNFKRLWVIGTIVTMMLASILVLTNSAKAFKTTAADKTPQPRNPGAFLTGPNEGEPLDIALNYIQQNVDSLGLISADLSELAVADHYMSRHNGVTHIYLRQQLNGIPVHNALLNINIAGDGSVINLGNRLVADLANSVVASEAAISPVQAVQAVAGELGLSTTGPLQILEVVGGPTEKVVLDKAGISHDAIPVQLMYQPTDAGVNLTWDITIKESGGQHWWSIRVDAATGTILSKVDWVVNENMGHEGAANRTAGNSARSLKPAPQIAPRPAPWHAPMAANNPDEYFVFAYPLESPDNGPPTLEMNPADPTSNPFGWHDTDGAAGPEFTITTGNNAWADSDLDANNIPDGNAPDGGSGLVFNHPYNLNLDPSLYLTASIVNLFYWNNIMHDISYRYGFDEASGNFQENNYGNGGLGSDSVYADAQDSIGVNNADFGTPPDGHNPRMQMYRTTYPFGQAVTVTAPLTLTGIYTANPSNNGGTANGLSGDIVLVVDGTAPTDDACQTVTNDLTGDIALVVWSAACNSSVFVQNAADAGAIAVIIVDQTVPPLTNFGGSAAIPSVAIGFDDGQLFLTALNNHTVTGIVGDHPFPGVDRDTGLDNGLIAHMYGHGISNRLTGGPSTTSCLGNQEQMGEGWSDLMTLIIHAAPGDIATDAREIGVWSLGSGYQGIRNFPYTTDIIINPQTYDDSTGASPHALGEIWAVMVWEVYWNLVHEHGFNPNIYDDWTTGGNNLTFQLMMDGMKLQPCSPGFVDGRDAILAADVVLTGGANQCAIWEGFAKRGLGFSADQGSPSSNTDGVEAFDMPIFCIAPDAVLIGSGSPDPVDVGSPLTYLFTISNVGVLTATNTVLTDVLDANTDFASVSTNQGSCSESAGIVTCNLNTLNPGDVVNVMIVVIPTQAGSVTNTAVVAVDEVEDSSNNMAVVTTTVEEGNNYVYLPVTYKP
jgi:uncharacterized repeat protein (TIGR01451 family)